MKYAVTATGNAGVCVCCGDRRVYVDSFFRFVPPVGGGPVLRGADALPARVILVTHAHEDHMDPEETRDAALASGAVVAGPARAVDQLAGLLPPDSLVALEPRARQRPPDSIRTMVNGIDVTAWRTYHGRAHNSYLFDLGGVRCFHDADNERTQFYRTEEMGRVDALFLCPWGEADGAAFTAALQPGAWFLIHMTHDELARHGRGELYPGLVAPVPPGVILLKPGQTMELDNGRND